MRVPLFAVWIFSILVYSKEKTPHIQIDIKSNCQMYLNEYLFIHLFFWYSVKEIGF